MKFFGKKKKDVLDLTGYYRNQQEKVKNMKEDIKESDSVKENENNTPNNNGFVPFPFLNTGTNNQVSENVNESYNEKEERRKKAARRLIDMTEKMEDLSNQIYHLQQRIEVLEKKLDVGRF